MINCKWKRCNKNKKCGKNLSSYNRTVGGYVNINDKELMKMIKENKNIILLDVRSVQEYNEGYINGATLIPLYELEKTAETKLLDKKQPIIVYCASGIRSIKAIEILMKKGYTNLYNLYGGLENY